ncbi:MAG: protein kinase [Comamonadaceae bacterium]
MKLDVPTLARLSPLMDEALELEDEQLAAWFSNISVNNADLVPALRELLSRKASVQTSDILQRGPEFTAPGAATISSDFKADDTVGPYRLLRELGRGGMGEVWLAERIDGALKRQVALKLPHSALRKRQLAERFARERDILGSLVHPNIARLYDAGLTPEGQPYLALEYVEGEALTTWCDARKLGIRARIELFRQVFAAVEYAHGQLVLHRDLKPTNILVTTAGEVRLLDFGIAKLMTDGQALETELTQLGGRAMSLQYASPEQILGQPLGTTSDVYSLGVVLHELLTGSLPYRLQRGSNAAIEEAVLNGEPTRAGRTVISAEHSQARGDSPRHLQVSLKGDIETLLQKALKKHAAERYGSAQAFAEDFERFLRGEPVQAKAANTAYRLHKFVQRHRWGVALGTASIVSLLAITATAVILGLQARDESARALAARDFLIDMFRQADPDLSHGAEITARQLLDQGQKTIVTTLNSQPLLQAELLRGLADAQANLADYAKADQTLSEAVKRFMQLGQRREAAIALAQQADTVQTMGDNGRAQDLLMQAVVRYPQYAGDAEFMAQYESVQGSIAFSDGNLPKARVLLASALAHANQAYGEEDLRTVPTIRLLAEIEAQAGTPQVAIQRLDKLLAGAASIKGLQAWDHIAIQMSRAGLENTAGQFGSAAEHFETAAKQCEKELNPDSETCTTVRSRQTRVLLVQGYRERALGLLPSLFVQMGADESPLRQAEALLLLSRVLALNGKQNERPELWARMRALGDSGPEVKQPQYVKLWALLVPAESLLHAGQPEAAQALLQRVQSRFEAGDRADRSIFGRLRLYQGLAAQALGQYNTALSLMQEATAEYARLSGADHPLTLLISVHQARALCVTHHEDQALALLNHALPLLQEALGPQSPTFLDVQALRNEITQLPQINPRWARKVDFFL